MNTNIYFVLLTFVVSLSMASLLIPRILLISIKKRLFDIPDVRKIHTDAVPRLGGVSFFPTILLAMSLVMAIRFMIYPTAVAMMSDNLALEFLFVICGLTIIYLIGIADDLVGVRYRKKMIVQVLAASFFPLSGLYINNFYGTFGIYEIPVFLGMFITMFLVVFLTNAINLIDGIDGLASGLSSVALVVFGSYFLSLSLWGYAMLSFGMLGVLLPFFYYNVFGKANRGKKIFMGDTGSLTLGYVLSFLAVKYSMYEPELKPYCEGSIVVAFSALIVPVFDVVRVILFRLRKGKSPFLPDKNHIHHKFLAVGFSPRAAMLIIISISCAFCVSNIILMNYVDRTALLLADIVIWIVFHLYLDKRMKERKRN